MVRCLTNELADNEKKELGVPTTPQKIKALESRLHDIHRRVTNNLNRGAWLGLTEQTRQARAAALQTIIDTMLAATHISARSTYFALDASGIHAWGRAKGRQAENSSANPDVDPYLHPDVDPDVDAAIDSEGDAEREAGAEDRETDLPDPNDADHADRGRAEPHDPQARYGYKTAKNGANELFYGYHLHALVRVAKDTHTDDPFPLAVQTFTVTPANEDVVQCSLDLLDDTTGAGITITKLLVDRHYSYKSWERWASALTTRNIKPVHDLRQDDHGFVDYNGIRIAAGWPHCPATPERLAVIQRPGLNATDSEKSQFKKRIEERHAYAFTRQAVDKNGNTRWKCPAVAGTVGCELRDGTVSAAQHMTTQAGTTSQSQPIPIVLNPRGYQPEDDTLQCCTQQTITIKNGPHMKMYQHHYWGTAEWEAEWKLRTYVEGWFGILKNARVGNFKRGSFQTIGAAHASLALLYAAVITNITSLRNWHKDNPNPQFADHALLIPETHSSAERIIHEPSGAGQSTRHDINDPQAA